VFFQFEVGKIDWGILELSVLLSSSLILSFQRCVWSALKMYSVKNICLKRL
jgi:hypothetical protein